MARYTWFVITGPACTAGVELIDGCRLLSKCSKNLRRHLLLMYIQQCCKNHPACSQLFATALLTLHFAAVGHTTCNAGHTELYISNVSLSSNVQIELLQQGAEGMSMESAKMELPQTVPGKVSNQDTEIVDMM